MEKLLKLYFFLLPTMYYSKSYMDIGFVTIGFSLLILFYLIITGSKRVFINNLIIYVIVFNAISVSYLFRVDRINYILNILFFINFFFLSVGFKYKNDLKRKCIDLFILGIIFCAARVTLWMLITNSFVKGGVYTESTIVSSNLDLPLMLSVSVIYLYFKSKDYKMFGKMFSYLMIGLSIFLLIFLQKRMPFISIIITIFFIPYIIHRKWFTYFFTAAILFFPAYSTIVMSYIEPIVKLSSVVLNRSEVQDSTRIDRWQFAEQMFSKFEFTNLFYYGEELALSYSEAHNHFHNTYLQIYVDKGLISLVIIVILIFKAVNLDKVTILFNTTYRNMTTRDIQIYRLLFMNILIISTNESIMRPVAFSEFMFISLLFINLDLSVFKIRQNLKFPTHSHLSEKVELNV